MEQRLPQYLHRPPQVLWFDQQEFIVLISVLFVGVVIIGGVIGWVLFASLLFIVLPWKRRQPRGAIPHLAYRLAVLKFRGYPLSTQSDFAE